MARSFTLDKLRDQAKELFDGVNASYPATAEWNKLISAAYTKLYDLLVESGEHYFESTQTINGDGTDDYALSADYYKTIGVDYKIDSTRWRSLRRMHIKERNRYAGGSSPAQVYRVAGSNLILLPAPVTGETYRHLYVPAAADLTTDTQSVDGVSGWERYIVIDAVIQARIREESDVTALMQERAIMERRIEEMKLRNSVDSLSVFEEEEDGRSYDPADWRWYEGGS